MASASSHIEIPSTLQRLLHDVITYQIPDLLTTKSPAELAEKERELLSTLRRIDSELGNFLLDATDAGSDAEERAAWGDALRTAQQRVAETRQQAQSALVRARRDIRAKARNALFEDMAESKEERERRRESNLADRRYVHEDTDLIRIYPAHRMSSPAPKISS